jgi:hypothetical protein
MNNYRLIGDHAGLAPPAAYSARAHYFAAQFGV